eukprot:scaffold11547_cov108-Isochrysis_galbana.AAC.6
MGDTNTSEGEHPTTPECNSASSVAATQPHPQQNEVGRGVGESSPRLSWLGALCVMGAWTSNRGALLTFVQ